ncbi:MAG: galactosyldiacylglycerol synthase [Burkholderiales bacterium RIFOXYC12_FULL_65_23]|uniref:glycosyltransferase n=1 Tax=Malikia spinosa TaxID=86180 RepID=UPI0008AE3C14|nr:glycosyltransferase [Malikia spinosa]OGB68844.1 MAG: galactosyldiacylglycerol synthase [Burkholderiales bacterium RIFOXYC12_FULL_65_23]
MSTIDLVYFNAGGGHLASAQALSGVLQAQGSHWQVRLVNLFEVLDPQDRFRKLTGSAPEDWYNRRLARGWTLGMAQELKLLQGLIRLAHPKLTRQLQQHWLRTEPDIVVSLIPNFNRALHESLDSALPGRPYVTVLTDLADLPPHFWIEPGQAQHFICGTPRAVEQARAQGHAEDRIHATSGMIIRPDFYRPKMADRASERVRHGLDPQRETGIVMFGGHGSKAMLGIARRLAEQQLILVCGHNRALARQLRAEQAAAPRLVVEFSRDIPYYMQLADYFIGKPGPGSLSEAVQQGLPVIVVDNAWTMPQERYNADWVREQGVGVVHNSLRTLADAVQQLTARLDDYRANVSRIDNQALFEIPPLLSQILERSRVVSQA